MFKNIQSGKGPKRMFHNRFLLENIQKVCQGFSLTKRDDKIIFDSLLTNFEDNNIFEANKTINNKS